MASAANSASPEISNARVVWRMLSYLSYVPRTAIIAALVVIARAGVEVWAVWYLKTCVNALSTVGDDRPADVGLWEWLCADQGSGAELASLLMTTAAIQALVGVMIYLKHVWDGRFSMYAVFYIRQAVYDRFQHIGFSVQDRLTSGQLINRALSDLQNVRMFLNLSVLGLLDVVAFVGGYMALLFLASPWLALGMLVPVPIWWLVVQRFGQRAQPLYRAQQNASDDLMTGLTENIAGVHVVRGFGTEARERAKFEALNATLLDRMFAMVGLQRVLAPTLRGVAVATHIGLLITAAALIQQGRLGVGDLIPIGLAIGTILSKIQQVNVLVETYQKAVVSGRRLFEVLDLPSTSATPRGLPEPVITDGTVTFEAVDFAYQTDKPVLQGVSCRLPGRSMTALIGPTGAGKSTLVSLIARFYDPQGGVIRIDGQDIRQLDLTALRRVVGYVFQETFLFSDTIANNIRFGRADVSEEMIRAAAEAAQAQEFIDSLPDGYHTMLGERGLTLSGGQRQRLALARALVYDPKILILDDATAALDPETEHVVSTILDLLYAGRTMIVIAHRVSSVRRADQVIVLDGGRVVQCGRHEQLMTQDGHYRQMVRLQLERDAPPP